MRRTQTSLEELLSAPVDTPERLIDTLRQRSRDMKQLRKNLTKDLRNAQRRNRRLKEKAKHLSDADILSIIRMRRDRQDAAASSNPNGSVESVADVPNIEDTVFSGPVGPAPAFLTRPWIPA